MDFDVALVKLTEEFAEVEKSLSDPTVLGNQNRFRELSMRHSELQPIMDAYARYRASVTQQAEAEELLAETIGDEMEEFLRAERDEAAQALAEVEDELSRLLAPKDPTDKKNAIVEIRAGTGGDEAALFAGDLFTMYSRYAELKGWKTEIIDATESELGGYKDVQVAVKSRGQVEPGQGVWARLKYEGGVHRVQRVPATESQGRIHTSAAGVLVTPEAEEVDVEINPNDLRVDVYRSSGPGGQSVNTTDSAVRITHLPTGVVASCQNEKSQLQNKEQALRILRSRLLAAAQEEAEREAADARRSQVRTVDRSEKIRTYNFPENRISDHRVGFKAYNLDQVLDGDLSSVIQACVDADSAAKLAAA